MGNDLTLEKWDRLFPEERTAVAKRIVRQLPDGFTFRAIRLYELGGQKHYVAEYAFAGASFALIPGGAVTLGYDPDRHWEPTEEELESWHGTAEEYGIDRTLREYVADVTLKPRTVHLGPLLMEITALKMRIQRRLDGTISVQRADACTHEHLATQLAKAGFRFPTSDEWEYACGAAAPTLFRWGDHVPCDRYPTDSSPDWDLHRRPNAFGIYIGSAPYVRELVAEPDVTRGGDGGCTICGGAGFFVGWLTLATAYFEEDACKRDPKKPVDSFYTVGRRVLPME